MSELREDVEDQCRQYGMMTGIAIDEQQLLVLVRYSTEEEAVTCMKALDGRLFDGRKLAAELAKEEKEKPEEDLLDSCKSKARKVADRVKSKHRNGKKKK